MTISSNTVGFFVFLQVQTLDETADRLVQTHPDQEEPIMAKRTGIDEAWNHLQDRVTVFLMI